MDDLKDLQTEISRIQAYHAIHDLVMTQARATDRGDLALLQSIWHPEATVDVGFFNGSAAEYCPMIIEATAAMQRMAHTITNEWIDVREEQAVAEIYVTGFTTFTDEQGESVSEVTVGRYLDRFSRREGVWKYDARQFVNDWQARFPATVESPDDPAAAFKTWGVRGPADPVYPHWEQP